MPEKPQKIRHWVIQSMIKFKKAELENIKKPFKEE